MAKDPAFLFYSNDFLTGTYTMRDDQVGKYIKLLCLQHQKGRLTEKDMMNICKSHDVDIFDKFKQENGLYFNERLDLEASKRKSYVESRSENRKGKKKTYVEHMENEDILNGINTVKPTQNGKTKNQPVNFRGQGEQLLLDRLSKGGKSDTNRKEDSSGEIER